MTTHNYNGVSLSQKPAIFRNLELAKSFANAARKTWLVLGEAGDILAVTPRDAERLFAAGYSRAI